MFSFFISKTFRGIVARPQDMGDTLEDFLNVGFKLANVREFGTKRIENRLGP